MQVIFKILILLMLCSCSVPEKRANPWRSLANSYEARFPSSWKVVENEAGLTISIEPAATVHLPNGATISVHLFREEIPPEYQIARWQKSFPTARLSPLSHGGYQGLLLEDDRLIAVAMQLSPHYEKRFPDYTLKATGEVAPFRNEILTFIRTFELVNEL